MVLNQGSAAKLNGQERTSAVFIVGGWKEEGKNVRGGRGGKRGIYAAVVAQDYHLSTTFMTKGTYTGPIFLFFLSLSLSQANQSVQ